MSSGTRTTVALLAGLLALRCAEPATVRSPCGSIELVPYVNEDFGIRTVVPNGWQEVESGAFRCDALAAAPARLILAYFPEMTREGLNWWFEAVVPGTAGIPDRIGELESEALNWTLHRGRSEAPDDGTRIVHLAIAETTAGIVAVAATAGTAEADRLNEELFLPVVAALAFAPIEEAVDYREENFHLFDDDPRQPLNIEESLSVDRGNFTEMTLSYASPMGGRVPATLMVPDGDGPFAGLILMHGQSLSRQRWLPWGRLYAEAGAVVILIDGPQHRPQPRSQPVVTFTARDRGGQIQLIRDLRRAVDLLVSRSDVDPDRLAYVGYSYGGAMGGLLAGVEHRLRAYALMVGDGGLIEHLTGQSDREVSEMFFDLPPEEQQAWRDAMWPIEPLHYVGHAAPASLLFQAAILDPMVPYPDAVRYQRAGSEPKHILWYHSEHILPDRAWKEQATWLQQRIGIDASVFP